MKQKSLFVVTLLFCVLSLVSCSSKLNESKIRTILKESLTSEDLNASVALEIGDVSFVSNSEIEHFKILEEEGLLIAKKNSQRSYNISLTDKANPYLVETIEKKIGIFGGISLFAKMKAFTYEVNAIEDIHENPSENTATARVTLKKVDKTPFAILLKDNTDFLKKKLNFFKTTEGEWKLLRNE